MDILTFVSSVVSTTAWPAVVVTLAMVFRKELREFSERVTEVKAHKISVKAAVMQLKEARRELPLRQVEFSQTGERFPIAPRGEVVIVRDRPGLFPLGMAPRTTRPVAETPREELEQAWATLQATLLEKARAFGAKRIKKAESAAAYLEDEGFVTDLAFHGTFTRLQAIHRGVSSSRAEPIDDDDALEFRQACLELGLYITQIAAPQ